MTFFKNRVSLKFNIYAENYAIDTYCTDVKDNFHYYRQRLQLLWPENVEILIWNDFVCVHFEGAVGFILIRFRSKIWSTIDSRVVLILIPYGIIISKDIPRNKSLKKKNSSKNAFDSTYVLIFSAAFNSTQIIHMPLFLSILSNSSCVKQLSWNDRMHFAHIILSAGSLSQQIQQYGSWFICDEESKWKFLKQKLNFMID